MVIEQQTLTYLNRIEPLAAALTASPWGVWLDSGSSGRFHILADDPAETLACENGVVVWCRGGERRVIEAEPLEFLRQRLRERRVAATTGLPFCGGAIGYFGYDFGQRRLECADPRPAAALPEFAVGFYDWAVVVDRHSGCASWVGRAEQRVARARVEQLVRDLPEPLAGPFELTTVIAQDPDLEAYAARFARVQEYLRAGDCYQVNLARRFSARYRGDPWSAYLRMRETAAGPFGAFLRLPHGELLSLSPERFLEIDHGIVRTEPIKGTRPRRHDRARDQEEAAALQASEKDRAENVMIVDLLRNDLGHSCVAGSVVVESLCELRSFPSVHHLVSTIRGRIAHGHDALGVLAACLPGGSITGAPKRRVVEIIAELEPARRGAYCGSMVYFSDDGRMDSNILIRTAQCANGEIAYWAGGGVVADSQLESEFAETQHKARPFLALGPS